MVQSIRSISIWFVTAACWVLKYLKFKIYIISIDATSSDKYTKWYRNIFSQYNLSMYKNAILLCSVSGIIIFLLMLRVLRLLALNIHLLVILKPTLVIVMKKLKYWMSQVKTLIGIPVNLVLYYQCYHWAYILEFLSYERILEKELWEVKRK